MAAHRDCERSCSTPGWWIDIIALVVLMLAFPFGLLIAALRRAEDEWREFWMGDADAWRDWQP